MQNHWMWKQNLGIVPLTKIYLNLVPPPHHHPTPNIKKFWPAWLETNESLSRWVPPLRDKDNEGERLLRFWQQVLKVVHHGLHQLFTERRVGLQWPTQWEEVQDGPEDGRILSVTSQNSDSISGKTTKWAWGSKKIISLHSTAIQPVGRQPGDGSQCTNYLE